MHHYPAPVSTQLCSALRFASDRTLNGSFVFRHGCDTKTTRTKCAAPGLQLTRL